MRLSGARPKRTWKVVVSSSTIASIPKVMTQRAVEAARLLVDLGGVAGDRDEIAALLAEIDGALDEAQLLAFGAVDVSLAGARRAPSDTLRSARCGSAASHSERDERTSGVGASSRVTCQYQPDSGKSNSGSPMRLRKLVDVLLGRGHVGDQRAQIDPQPAVERALHRGAVDRRQHDPGDDQNYHGPGRRREEQPKRERIKTHCPAAARR